MGDAKGISKEKGEGKKGGQGGGKTALKIPKGTRDWFGPEALLRDKIFSTLGDIFSRHGAVPLDTPVFELKDILSGKYGEDSKLIYDLADQGGEICALRYDLTVPFARWLAMNSVQQVKRYHIAKVYRRDQPAIARGRMREFYQCDFDIAGEYDPMIPDAEILRIIVEAFTALGLREEVTIKINHRKILDGLFTVAGVPDDKIRTISSAVDKLDKSPWEEVKKEMLEKGLTEEIADQIGKFTKHNGSLEKIIDILRNDEKALKNDKVKQGLDDMEKLVAYTQEFGISDKISFDLALARGLDYYTGVIYEVVIELPSEKSGDTRIGSIAAGGRYDNLVGMYGKKQIPCVGISFGVDRIFTILQKKHEAEKLKPRGADVFIMAFGGKNGLLLPRMAIARTLWDGGVRAEFLAKAKPKLPQQFKAAEDKNIPVAVILGEDELAAGKVRIKILGLPDGHPDKDGRLVERDNLVEEVKKTLTELPTQSTVVVNQ
ncbi:cytoplasmic and mitochondrial histidine tRNA synthetase [Diplogelasinospora grovesii]|uniref:Histidine--tRNA ligase, mitochondrial n=1 Tax=Diplogelasinospora grovesii TaxID=303347 RepID=A0AAN6S1X1_9PEZI|nr:cytoplasmic and mitochondrial histidine tRNA synthetase [Diplogelasinospora grovesii]